MIAGFKKIVEEIKLILRIVVGTQQLKLAMALIFFFLLLNKSDASPVTVTAKTDTTQIRIGEQFHLNLTAKVSPGNKVSFPFLTDTFNHFEIVKKSAIDTVSAKGEKELTLQQLITLTSFDSGFYVIPPLPFLVNESPGKSDTILTEAMLISVLTVPVDTTKAIKALKEIIYVPFPWMDYLLYLVIAVIVIGLIIFLIKKFRKKETVQIRVPVVPKRPAHEIALEGLKRIEQEKLWQQGFTKKYFSEVTDVLRQYIEGRFSFYAMEQTTDEILNHFANDLIREEEKEKLKFILRHADMVKFAKAQSLPAENENTIQYAYAFVNNTRPVVKSDFDKAEETK